MDPMQIIQMIKNGQNPQQLIISILQNNYGQTPFGANLLQLAKENKTQEIEQIARNLCQQRGVDFDTAFKEFRNNLNL